MANTIQNRVQQMQQGSKEQRPIRDLIKVMEPEIKKALPSVITPERFTRIALSALSANPKLAACTAQSFLAALMSAAQLGLEVNSPLGQAYLIPYKNSRKDDSGNWVKVDEVQFQIGYKGMIDLANRSKVSVGANIVYENDIFEIEYGLNPKLRHVPASGDRGKPIKVYAIFRTEWGACWYEADTLENVRDFAQKYSKAYENSPWKTDFEAMAKKTLIKRALKYAPMSPEFAHAIAQDETVKTEISEDMYDVPNTAAPIDATFEETDPSPIVKSETGDVGK